MLKVKYLSIALIIPTCCFCSPKNKKQNVENDTFVFSEVFTAEHIERARQTILNLKSMKIGYIDEYQNNIESGLTNYQSQGQYEYDYSIDNDFYFYGNSMHTEVYNNKTKEIIERELVIKNADDTGYDRYYQENDKAVAHTNLTEQQMLEGYDSRNGFASLYSAADNLHSLIFPETDESTFLDDKREYHIKYENDGSFIISLTGYLVYHISETVHKQYYDSDYFYEFTKDYVLIKRKQFTRTTVLNGEYEFQISSGGLYEEYIFDEEIARKTPENFNQ